MDYIYWNNILFTFQLSKQENMICRNITNEDVTDIRILVNDCKPLDLHTPFTYWVLSQYFNNICFVLTDDENQFIGFVFSIKSSTSSNVLYLWQIGIIPSYRKQNLSKTLIGKTIEAARKLNCTKVQFSIDPENKASYHSFLSFATVNEISMKAIGALSINDSLIQLSENEVIYEYDLLAMV